MAYHVQWANMKGGLNPFSSIPAAIILGSVLISFSILLQGGIIKIKANKAGVAGVQTTAQPSIQPSPSPQPQVTLDQIKQTFNKSQIKFGDTNQKLVVIEVADPSCPYCHIAAGKNPELNKQIDSQFTLVGDGGSYIAPVPEFKKLIDSGKAAFAYIYSPGHGNGEMGTKALYCAFEGGKFWEVHDLLMSSAGYDLLNNKVKNDKSKSGDMASFLQPVFDPTAMKACLDSGKYDNRITEDPKLASDIGIRGTPGFYLNFTIFKGAYSFKDMEPTVKSALGN